MLHNSILWVSVFTCILAQLIKVFSEYLHTKEIKPRLLLSTGGMPSSHSAFVASITTSVGLAEGFDSNLFAVSLILSLIVMYDAAGVRRAAGKQASVINTIISDIEKLGIKIDEHLKELLGHSPVEVIGGAILGIFTSVASYVSIVKHKL
jgi:acid phosphatase family membrane protein YuiD